MSIFSKVNLRKPKRSTFNLSCDRKLTFSMGKLVPIHVQEIVPGDKFRMSTQQMIRLAPMIAPVMHEVNVYIHHFFVPNRLVWPDWEDFITGGDDGLSAILPPFVREIDVPISSLADYLGIPATGDTPWTGKFSLIPFAAYQMIYNEYYRDQNLIDPVDFKLESGTLLASQVPHLLELRTRAWRHDYFTSALPFSQKGASVNVPLYGEADIIYERDPQGQIVRDPITGEPIRTANLGSYDGNDSGALYDITHKSAVNLDVSATHKVDLSSANSGSINELRKAFKLQEWLEKNARAGSRYVESILAHFGVKSSDARLQRPEYLGGGMSPIMISEVLQTSETQDTPQANMAGHGLNLGSNSKFSRFFEEHGYVISIMSVIPKSSYQQGTPRHFHKYDKFDYFFPEFQHIGEQAIKYRELLETGVNPDDTFGYSPRYAEYKFNPSSVHGYFRTNLDFWHLGRQFSYNNRPSLNKSFVECNPTRRIFAVTDPNEDTLYAHVFHNISASRLMSYFGDPSFR